MRNKLRRAYTQQKHAAKKRNIDFLLSYEEWLDIWNQSGKLHLRGCRKDQYVMARHADKGPYAIGNVTIKTTGDNAREAFCGTSRPTAIREKIRNTLSGKKQTPEVIEARTASRRNGKGWAASEETKKKISETKLRKTWWPLYIL